MDRLSHLNAPQRAAVRTRSGPLLVLAGAGTGKTRVITYRMAELIKTGTQPQRILSVTFTNKAAKEMQKRTAELLGKKRKQRPMVSTFHSFCVKVLRNEIHRLGYPPGFTIMDRGDQEAVARAALRDIRMNDKTMRPSDLINRISRWKMAGVKAEGATDYVDNDFDFLSATAYRKYQKRLRAMGGVDFDDLLLLTLDLFENETEVVEKWAGQFDHVQVDEYQDTNGVQFRLIKALVKRHLNLCVVGDDDQSIYGWRGAEVEHILGFRKHFPTAKIVRLEDNYRCTDRILELANRLVRYNTGRHEKRLIPHKMSGAKVRYFKHEDETKEAEHIVSEIAYMQNELEVNKRDFAILFRTNEQPRVFEQEFRRQQVRYVLVGGQSFFDRKEVRDLMAYLKTLENPADEVSLRRIINMPARGIGDTTISKILERAVRDAARLWDYIEDPPADIKLTQNARAALSAFHAMIEQYRTAIREEPNRMHLTFERLIRQINYDAEIERNYKQAEQQTARRNIVTEMVQSLQDYQDRAQKPSLTQFLEQSALTDRSEEGDKENQLAQDAVKLMTLHAAKGLEFPRVYLVGMEEGLLPHQRSIDGTDANIQEERRLAYVGVTRSQDHLTVSRALTRKKFGKKRNTQPSRFLREMFTPWEDEIEAAEKASGQTDEHGADLPQPTNAPVVNPLD